MARYGSGSLFQRGKKGIWHYQAWVNGRQIGPRSAKTTNRIKAEKELNKLLGKKARNEHIPVAVKYKPKTEVDSIVEQWPSDSLGKILADYLQFLKTNRNPDTHYIVKLVVEKHLYRPFGLVKKWKLRTEMLQQYREDRLGAGAMDSTINRELCQLRAAMWKYIETNHDEPIPVPYFPMTNEDRNARQEYRDEPDFLKFLACLLDDLKPFACCAYYGGMRRGELVKLDLTDIEIEKRFIVVKFGKNDETRAVPIYDGPMLEWMEWLWRMRVAGQTKAFVYHTTPGKIRGHLVTRRNFYDFWHEAAKQSGVAGANKFLPHDGRRSSNRKLSREGVPQALRMKIHGWRTPDMDHRYGITDTADVDAVRDMVNKRRAENITTAKTTASKPQRKLKTA